MPFVIRHALSSDAAGVHRIFLSQHVIDGTMRLPHAPLADLEARLAPARDIVKLVAAAGNEIVGFSELVMFTDNPRHKHAGEINMITTSESWQGKGVGRALMAAMIDMADNWLNLRRVGLTVWSPNVRAIRLYESFGFSVEGVMPSYVFVNGRYVDATMMGRIRQPAQSS